MTVRGSDRSLAGVQSAQRMLSVLEEIASSPDGLTAAEIAGRTALSTSTVYRLLAVLRSRGFVGSRLPDRRFVLGGAAERLGRAVSAQLAASDHVRRAVRRVRDDAGAPAYLTVFQGDDIGVAFVADSTETPRIAQLHVGFAEAAHVTAFGKVMLATMEDARLAEFVAAHGLPPQTPVSVRDVRSLREQLEQVRSHHVAVEIEEYMPKLACIAAPVHSAAGDVVGAISVSVQAKDFGARAGRLEGAVRRGALRVSGLLARMP